MSLFLAIDAGGTKTRCLLADETQVLGHAATGSIKLMRVGEAEASARLQAMLTEVSLTAGVTLSEVTQTCIGLAGLTIEAVREWAEREIGEVRRRQPPACRRRRDRPRRRLSRRPGNSHHRRHRLQRSGPRRRWSHVSAPEAGAPRSAMKAQASGSDKRPCAPASGPKIEASPTTLLTEIGEFWGAKSLGEIVEMANARPGPDFPALAPLVVRCAEAR